jgi:anaerobic selenocysteine-containing dehydrogenase
MTATARLAHYVLPPKLQYERTDLLFGPVFEPMLNIVPFQQYIPAVVEPPTGSEVIDDWYFWWALAKRLELPLRCAGAPVDLETPPTTDDLLALITRDSAIPFEELRRHSEGKIFDVGRHFVQPARPGVDTRFEVAPVDIVAELAEVCAEPIAIGSQDAGRTFTHRLTVRRLREVLNSLGSDLDAIRRRRPWNPAWLHPGDLDALGVAAGDRIEIASAHGRIEAIALADPALRRGVVSMSHGFGALPGEDADYEEVGASTNRLVATDRCVETINAMPRFSAIPVDVLPMRARQL